MNNKQSLQIRLEVIWWIFTFILAGGVLFPILSNIENFPFLLINMVFIIVFITFTRYLFLLKYTFLAKKQILKIAIVVMSIPVIFLLGSHINGFQTFLDEQGAEALVGDLSFQNKESMAKYIRSEILFFGVGSVIVATLLPFRLIISVWRTRNKGTV